MFCRNCANEVDEKAVACTKCGVPPLKGTRYCSNCGKETLEAAIMCVNCGVSLKKPSGAASMGESKRIIVGICAIILGYLGIHKFILGYQKEGFIMLLVTVIGAWFTCGITAGVMGLIGLIEGIIYLLKTDEEFENTYVTNRKPWF